MTSSAMASSGAMTSGAMTSGAMTSGAMTSGAMTSGAMTSGAMTSGSAATFAGSGFACATGTLQSSGSTAQGAVMAQWIKAYNAKCSATVNAYGGGGSGKGVTDFISNQVDFGGSDSALKTASLQTPRPSAVRAMTPSTCPWSPARSQSASTSQVSAS